MTTRKAKNGRGDELRRERFRLVTRWRLLLEAVEQLNSDVQEAGKRGVFTEVEAANASHQIGTAAEELLNVPTLRFTKGAKS